MRSVLLHCLIYKVHSLEFLAHQRNLRISHLLPFVNPFFKVFLKLFSGPTRALHFSLRSLKRSVNITRKCSNVNTFFKLFFILFSTFFQHTTSIAPPLLCTTRPCVFRASCIKKIFNIFRVFCVFSLLFSSFFKK